MKPTPPLRPSFVMIYEGEKAAFDEACDKAMERAIASGNIVKQHELLLQLDRMTREYRDL